MIFDAIFGAFLNAAKSDPTLAQGALAFLVPRIVEAIKRWSHLTFIGEHTDGLNRALSMVTAFCVSFGISAQATGSVDTGWQVSLTIPPLAFIVEAAMRLMLQGGLQEAFYRTTVKDRPGILRTVGGGIAHATANTLAVVGLAKKKEAGE